MIKKILLLFVLLLLTNQPSQARINNLQFIILKIQTERICAEYNKECTVGYMDTKVVNAFTTIDGKIILHKGLMDLLTYREVEAVILHELGHHIQDHCKKDKALSEAGVSPKEYTHFRKMQELEADLWGTEYCLSHHKKPLLGKALSRITGKYYYLESASHPSPYKRAKMINRYIEISKLLNLY